MIAALRSNSVLLKILPLLMFSFVILDCKNSPKKNIGITQPFLVVLGVTQDGGYPQAGTKKSDAWDDPSKRRHVSSLAIVDPAASERWMIDATPDFRDQLHGLDQIAPVPDTPGLTGIFLTHAHIGHYTGLMHLGREVIGAKNVTVYAMPKMYDFLKNNGPWDLLVRLKNIDLHLLAEQIPVQLNDRISITPFLVPHRAEYTETVGYRIDGPKRSVLFIPDIDKWEDWDSRGTHIEDMIRDIDVAYLDGTFYADGEIPGRSMYDIPHPFIEQSMDRFALLPLEEKRKIRFIHLNRTNPALHDGSDARKAIEKAGLNVAKELEIEIL